MVLSRRFSWAHSLQEPQSSVFDGRKWKNCLASWWCQMHLRFFSALLQVYGEMWWISNNFQVWEGCSLPRIPQVFLAAVVYYWYHYFAPRLWPQTEERQDAVPVTAGTATPTSTAVPESFKALSRRIGLIYRKPRLLHVFYPELQGFPADFPLWDWELRAELRAGCRCRAVQNSTVVRNLKSGRLLCRPKKLLVCKISLDLPEIRLFVVTFHDFPVKCICDLEDNALFISHLSWGWWFIEEPSIMLKNEIWTSYSTFRRGKIIHKALRQMEEKQHHVWW